MPEEKMIRLEIRVTHKRVPVQGDYAKEERKYKNAGTISWSEHLEIYKVYVEKFGGSGQSPERVAERGGFSYNEIILMTGHPPSTWKPNENPR